MVFSRGANSERRGYTLLAAFISCGARHKHHSLGITYLTMLFIYLPYEQMKCWQPSGSAPQQSTWLPISKASERTGTNSQLLDGNFQNEHILKPTCASSQLFQPHIFSEKYFTFDLSPVSIQKSSIERLLSSHMHGYNFKEVYRVNMIFLRLFLET